MEKTRIKILLIEDDDDDFVLFEDLISRITPSEFHLERANTYESAMEAILRGEHDICFLDYRLGAHDGLEILRKAPSMGFESPIVFLTGKGDYDVDLQAMEAGAAEYLVKDKFDAAILERVIRYALARGDFQRALKKANDELELRVEERTRQLAEAIMDLQNEIEAREQEETQRKKLELKVHQADKMKAIGTLSGGIAHDFNNLLTSVLGNINLAQADADPKDNLFNFLGAAEKATLQAADLTRKLITFSRGGTPVKKKQMISHFLKEACEAALHESSVVYKLTSPEDPWMVEIDEKQMQIALNGILHNALEAMPQGGTVTVKAENISAQEDIMDPLPLKKGKYVKVSIGDQGCGIPQDLLPHIFDPYFTTKEMGSQKGMGLGLSIAHSIIKKHGGYIFAESKVSNGTTFEIYFPAIDPDQTKDSREPIAHALSVTKGKILVMDDERGLRLVTRSMLEHLGYEVELAEDGFEALTCYENALNRGEGFEAVVLDLIVPNGMGGKQTIQRLREIDPNVRAIISTGYSDDSIIKDYAKFGFKGVLPKPYDLKQLDNAILETIDSSH
jgi:signal transduction histidine kinase